MTWLPLLLADPSPCLRMMVLTEVLGHTADHPEIRELKALRETDPLVADLVALQTAAGFWEGGDLAWPAHGRKIYTTSLALARLGYLGFGSEHPAVQRGATYLFSVQKPDGSWPLPKAKMGPQEQETYTMMPLQTTIPLYGLAACGYATTPQAERAYEWLLAQRLPDGAWPTGILSGDYGYVAGYRRLAHSRWGCRSNTTGALACLAHHPDRRAAPAAQRALDLLLGCESKKKSSLGFEVARLIGLEPARGFLTHYALFDLALVLDLCGRIGATQEDERVAAIVAFVLELQGPYGLWEYDRYPQAARWITFDLLRSLSRLDKEGDWLSLEPPTPFQTYPQKPKRF